MKLRQSLRAALIITFSLTLYIGGSHAETFEKAGNIPQDSAFWAFLQSPQHAKFASVVAGQEDARIGLACREDAQYAPGALVILNPVTMQEGDTQPTAGRWIERYTIEACGIKRVYNALFTIGDDGGMTVLPVVPGLTARSFGLLRDLRPHMEALANIENCAAKTVYDTFVGLPGGYEAKNAEGQYETWFVAGCGQRVALVLAFSAGEDDQVNISVEQQLTIQDQE
jgi:hypothetical protein